MSDTPQLPINNLRPILSPWAVLPPGYQASERAKDLFDYELDFLNATSNKLPSAGTVTGSVQISNDSDFLWCSTTGIFSDTSDVVATVFPAVTCLFTDSGSGRQLSSAAVHVGALLYIPNQTAQTGMAGTWYPKLLSGGSTLTVVLTNLLAADRNVRLTFRGIKIFPMGR